MARVTAPVRARFLRAGALALAGLLAGAADAAVDPAVPPMQPYTARYAVSYRGLSGGEIEASFRHGSTDGLWQYETRVVPNSLGRSAVSSNAHDS
ncbi:MAG: hypothetical protein ACR2I8_04090, partial [Steroidobacteraceae bacterium]